MVGLRGLQDRVGGRRKARARHGRISMPSPTKPACRGLVSDPPPETGADATQPWGRDGSESDEVMDIDEVGVGQGETFEVSRTWTSMTSFFMMPPCTLLIRVLVCVINRATFEARNPNRGGHVGHPGLVPS